jgi:uncharacterized protein
MEISQLNRLRQTNPWLFGGLEVGRGGPSRAPEPWVERTQVDLARLREPRGAHLIVGPRQAGKSSLVWSLLRGLARPLYLNMEEPTLRSWCGSPAQFLSDLDELGAPPEAVFLEEAQWLDAAALFVQGLVDSAPGFPILVTGSSSFHLLDRTRETLAGRASRHVLLPFSLAEVVPDDGRRAPGVLALERRDALHRQLRYGGYPAVWLSTEPETLLGDLLEAFVLRDASDLFAVDRLDAYQKLLQLCARGVGNLVNLSELASICGVAVGTISRYLELMAQAHVIALVPSFSLGKRREVTSARKVFFLDNGLRNAAIGAWPAVGELDRGALYENWVFGELRKGLPWRDTIRYWRSLGGAEVDFVVERGERLLAVEVKAGALSRPAVSRSSRSFLDAYAPGELWVLNETLEAEHRLGPTVVRHAPSYRLPEMLQGWLRAR